MSDAACDVVAGIDLTQADPAIDRGGDAAVSQIELGAVDGGLVGSDGAFILAEGGLQRIQVLLGDDAAFIKRLVALVLRLGVVQLRFVALQVGLRRGQRYLVRPLVDDDQQVTLADVLPFLEIDLHDLPINPALQRDGVEGLH